MRTTEDCHYKAVVMGVSFGGLSALKTIIPQLPADFPVPIMVVQHHDRHADDFLASFLNNLSALQVKVAEEKEKATGGFVYLAPANYHLLVEDDTTLSLSLDEKINYARPSVDVLFESAADVYGARLIGIILTGANKDGSKGLRCIQKCGGLTIVQDPVTAEAANMPEAAIAATTVDHIVDLNAVAPLLISLFS